MSTRDPKCLAIVFVAIAASTAHAADHSGNATLGPNTTLNLDTGELSMSGSQRMFLLLRFRGRAERLDSEQSGDAARESGRRGVRRQKPGAKRRSASSARGGRELAGQIRGAIRGSDHERIRTNQPVGVINLGPLQTIPGLDFSLAAALAGTEFSNAWK
jgi:hypothetical protein